MPQRQVIPVTGVLQYEIYGFTNCVLYSDVLYLSGVSALNAQSEIVGATTEDQTIQTYKIIETVAWTRFCR